MAALTLLVAVSLGTGCFTPRFSRNESLRPLKIRVVDAVLGRPLVGVPVRYAVGTMKERGRFLGVMPSIEPDVGSRLRFKARGRTDEAGEVEFHAERFRVPGSERVEDEYAFVNLDVNPDSGIGRVALTVRQGTRESDPDECSGPVNEIDLIWGGWWGHRLGERLELFRNPVAAYRGVIAISDRWGPNPETKDWTEPEDRFRISWNPETLQKRSEVLEVALVPYVSEEELRQRIASAHDAIAGGKGDRRDGYAAIARDARVLALLAGSEDLRARFREEEREAYRELARSEPSSPAWFMKWAESLAEMPKRVPVLREGVERFPRDYGLRAALGLALCKPAPSTAGVEQLKEAVRLLPDERVASEGTSLAAAAWLCGDQANEVARIAAERSKAQRHGAP